MAPFTQVLLERFERQVEADFETMVGAVAAINDYAPNAEDAILMDELRELGRQHITTFLRFAEDDRAPDVSEFDFMRRWGEQKARDMVPLPANLHTYFIGQQLLADRIVAAAGPDVGLRAEALRLVVRLTEYTALALTASVEGYTETMQRDRADREVAQGDLLEQLLTSGPDTQGLLTRRAANLGLEAGRSQVVVIIRVEPLCTAGPSPMPRRWAAQALARGSGRGANYAFVVVRSNDVVAVLDSGGDRRARTVVEEVQRHVQSRESVSLTGGIGTPFMGLPGVRGSYDEARRALRHCTPRCPIICSPDDITLVEDLAVSSVDNVGRLIPARTRQALADPELRSTLEAYITANLNVAATAKALILHPNSVRYRLKRIATLTGRDPRQFSDLFELRAAARILERETRQSQV
jgi:sugar diacid utilization regulator